MDPLKYVPLDAEAKYGNTQLVKLGPTMAAAWWTGSMWAYRGTNEQLDFEPTHYAVFASADTHPKGGDAKAAPFMGSAVGNAETPNLSHSEGE